MDLLKLIVLAIIQGITEILPISSSGHLILFKHIFGIENYGLTLEIFLHVGSLIAIIFYYRHELKKLLFDSFSYVFNKIDRNNTQKNFKLLCYLLVSTFITGFFALLFMDFIETSLGSITFLPFFFLITAIGLFFIKNIKSNKCLNDISLLDSIKIGLFQVLGIIPGISRSGSTIIGCKFSKLDDASSFKYSFLLFIPITLSSFILKLFNISNMQELMIYPSYYYFIGIITSCIVTYISINLFSSLIKKESMHYFSYYLIIISLITIIVSRFQ